MTHERQHFADLVGTARTLAEQSRQVWGTALIAGVVALSFGLLGSPYFAGAFLPAAWETRIAATVMDTDRWDAGEMLLQADNPAAYEKMTGLYTTCGTQTVEFCAQAIAEKALRADQGSAQPPPANKSKSGAAL